MKTMCQISKFHFANTVHYQLAVQTFFGFLLDVPLVP